MAFQGRHQTRSGIRKINSVLLEGKGQEGRLWSEEDWFMSAASHPLLPISTHGSAGSGCLLSTSAGVTNQGQSIKSLLLGSSFAARVLALSQLCPLQCQWGTGSQCTADKGKSDQRYQTVSLAHRGWWVSGRSQAARYVSTIWPVLSRRHRSPYGQFLAGGRGEVLSRPASLAALLGCLVSPTTPMHWGTWLGGGKQ